MVHSTFMDAARKLHIPAQYIDVLPDACGGRQHIRGTRVKISETISRHVYQEESVDDVVEALPQLTLAKVHAAMAYYYDNHGEVEAGPRAEDEFVVLRMVCRPPNRAIAAPHRV